MPYKILFLLGAGCSVSGGLPVYRGQGGIYKADEDPSRFLSINAFNSDPRAVWERLRPLYTKIRESKEIGEAYTWVKTLVEESSSSLVVTQNIDGFAVSALGAAGDAKKLPSSVSSGLSSRTRTQVIELHGSHQQMECLVCKLSWPSDSEDPVCPDCARVCRPKIVLFGERVPMDRFRDIYKWIKEAVPSSSCAWEPLILVCVGTTLQFQYLLEIVKVARSKGAHVVHINPDESAMKNRGLVTDIYLTMKAEEGLRELSQRLKWRPISGEKMQWDQVLKTPSLTWCKEQSRIKSSPMIIE